MTTPIYYNFQQRFNVPAREAFEWCTTYTPEDYTLMGEKVIRREIEHITDRTVILTDTFDVGTENQIEKQKLVQLYPNLLFWTSTHISGPAKHSQFIYQITAESDSISNLDFTGLFLYYGNKKISEAHTAKLVEKTCNEDARVWELLAKAMEQELLC
ncbi:MAG: hypothetical protein MI892_30670 [Desulfobacterales bacterium]|nr:hypothetical protein [Desulfobacterales bacterium]